MRNRSHPAVFLTLAITLLIAYSLPLSSKEPVKILFIGSSYFNYNNLPEIFRQLSEQGGEVLFIDQHIPSGLFLTDHVEHALTRSKIKSKRWDYVILQGVGIVMAYPDSISQHSFHPAMKSLMKSITRNSPSTKTVFCMPWAYEDGMAWKEGWSDNYDDMQQKIIHNTLDYAEQMRFIVAPVGMAWSNVLKEKAYPLHYLHFSDWNHPTKRGSYLMACVLYSTIFQQSTVANPYNAGLEQEEALYFREMGSNTVLDSMQHWNTPVLME
ncbi:MAG: DUF4886 domain-containing protein [Bacteroidales bacterium]|nr:DUF4886 domain-containing protein [Bacteroidales bacterium]